MQKKLIVKKAVANIVSCFQPLFPKKTAGDSFRVLTYHSIPDEMTDSDPGQMTTPRAVFEEQMKYLRQHQYSVISCDDAVRSIKNGIKLPSRAVCITFDDGFKDCLTNASPILQELGFKATIFLTVDFMENGGEWLGWDGAAKLAEMKIFSIGSHCVTHKRLSSLDEKSLENEIAVSKKTIEDKLKVPARLIAYPFGSFGSFDERVIKSVKAAGYDGAFTTIAGYNKTGSDPYTMRRTRISWFDEPDEFTRELNGAYDWYRYWQKISKSL